MNRCRIRTAESHVAYESMFLQRMLFGRAPISHPEVQEFMQGLSMPCENGFVVLNVCLIPSLSLPRTHNQLLQAIQSYFGGIPAFIRQVAGGRITSESLARVLDITEPASTSNLTQELLSIPGHPFTSFTALLNDWLVGQGVPHSLSIGLRDQHIVAFTAEDTEDPGFRARMLHRAATGMDQINPRQRVRVSRPALLLLVSSR